VWTNESKFISRNFDQVLSSSLRFSKQLISLCDSVVGRHVEPSPGWTSMRYDTDLDHITAHERLTCITGILAAGLMRLLASKSSPLSGFFPESSLAPCGNQSGHVQPFIGATP
jgi:hypothetical protein